MISTIVSAFYRLKSQILFCLQCNDNSQELPDNVLQFIKARPLMDQSVTHSGGRPLYHQKDVIFQRMAVHQQDQYTVFFLGTSELEMSLLDF